MQGSRVLRPATKIWYRHADNVYDICILTVNRSDDKINDDGPWKKEERTRRAMPIRHLVEHAAACGTTFLVYFNSAGKTLKGRHFLQTPRRDKVALFVKGCVHLSCTIH